MAFAEQCFAAGFLLLFSAEFSGSIGERTPALLMEGLLIPCCVFSEELFIWHVLKRAVYTTKIL